MKGRKTFTQAEIAVIKDLLVQKERALPSAQKGLRRRMRDRDFHIRDFVTDQRGFTARDLDRLIQTGDVKVV